MNITADQINEWLNEKTATRKPALNSQDAAFYCLGYLESTLSRILNNPGDIKEIRKEISGE